MSTLAQFADTQDLSPARLRCRLPRPSPLAIAWQIPAAGAVRQRLSVLQPNEVFSMVLMKATSVPKICQIKLAGHFFNITLSLLFLERDQRRVHHCPLQLKSCSSIVICFSASYNFRLPAHHKPNLGWIDSRTRVDDELSLHASKFADTQHLPYT